VDLVQAILLGIIQGVTEWLPISSTAHLRVVPALLGWRDPGAAFTAIIQLGTTLAVILYFRKDLAQVISGWIASWTGGPKNTPESRIGWGVFCGTLPIIIIGITFKDAITGPLRSLYVISAALIVFGVFMAIVERFLQGERTQKDLTVLDGVMVGCFQVFALIPGVSRSGSTMTGGLFRGLDRQTAARFSFLLSLPSVIGAGIFEMIVEREAIAQQPLIPLLVATSVSFLVGYASIAWLLKYLQKRGLAAFTLYRVVLGIVLLALLQQGILQPFDAEMNTDLNPNVNVPSETTR
jgi:undecaprenyl-diphosphatase